MTIWRPDLSGHGPRYRQLADAIARDIDNGRLAVEEKLPPQRRLAYALGVTVGTVTRAYAEAERRGLVQARVGSGTYVRGADALAAPLKFRQVAGTDVDDQAIDLSLSLPPPSERRVQDLASALASIQQDSAALVNAIGYQPERGLAPHRSIYAAWMTRLGLPVAADELIVNQGGMHGLFLALSTLIGPDDRVAAESLTYPGFISACHQLRARTVAVPFDDEGIDVQALEQRHERQPFRALYLMPAHHNPTTAVLSPPRRHALAQLARERDFWLIEDGVMHQRPEHEVEPLYRLAPERSIYLFSVSKILGGGLRAGVMRVPPALRARIEAALRAQSWMPPPLMASIACQWIASGQADRLLAWQTRTLAARHRLVGERWADLTYSAQPGGFYVWLRLPEAQRAASLVETLAAQGIHVTSSEAFCLGSEPAPQAVRVCISAARDDDVLARALDRIRDAVLTPAPMPWRTL